MFACLDMLGTSWDVVYTVSYSRSGHLSSHTEVRWASSFCGSSSSIHRIGCCRNVLGRPGDGASQTRFGWASKGSRLGNLT